MHESSSNDRYGSQRATCLLRLATHTLSPILACLHLSQARYACIPHRFCYFTFPLQQLALHEVRRATHVEVLHMSHFSKSTCVCNMSLCRVAHLLGQVHSMLSLALDTTYHNATLHPPHANTTPTVSVSLSPPNPHTLPLSPPGKRRHRGHHGPLRGAQADPAHRG